MTSKQLLFLTTTSSLQTDIPVMLNIQDPAQHHSTGPPHKESSVSVLVPSTAACPTFQFLKCQSVCVVNSPVGDRFLRWWFISLAISRLDSEINEYARLSFALADGQHSDSGPSLR